VRLVCGGASRQESVFAAVKESRGEYVLVHDAARPCVNPEVILRCLDAALAHGAAIAALPCSDTIKRSTRDGFISATLDRQSIWRAQTPQIFRRDWLRDALDAAQSAGFSGTDCSSLLERAGQRVALVEGDLKNIKVTFACDFELAQSYLEGNL
jgi:2-C-methyl-D-erythritol 4-phosphate cytidylyltransferase